MKKTNKILINLAIIMIVFLSVVGISKAQTPTPTPTSDYTVLAPLPGIGDTTGGKTNLKDYIPAAFKLAIGISAVLAFAMITFGGIMYATSDAINNKSQGKEYATNAIYGLLLVLAAYAILNTINPDILTLNLTLPKPNISSTAPSVAPGGAATGACNCVALSSLGIPTIRDGIGQSISQSFSVRLSTLSQSLNSAGVSWGVTEGYVSSQGPHVSDSCHLKGMCVDAVLVNPTASNINAFASIANSNGLGAVYEVQTDQQKNALVASGVRAPLVVVNPSANGQHFHIR